MDAEVGDKSRQARKLWQERRTIFSMSVDEVEEEVEESSTMADRRTQGMLPGVCSRRMSLDMAASMSKSLDNGTSSGRRTVHGGNDRRNLQRASSFAQPSRWLLPPTADGDSEQGPGTIKDTEDGIVCSDEDLHSILSDKSQQTSSTSGRRQKLHGTRSLSLDSSFFKLKRAQTETHAWFARILSNQRGSEESSSKPEQSDEDSQLTNLEDDHQPQIQTHPISPTRSICSSSSEEENVSLLTVAVEPSGTSTNVPVTVDPQATETSKVIWDKSSVVDAELLGHAIESYLTTPGRKLSAPAGPRDNMAVSTSLKELFVKLIH